MSTHKAWSKSALRDTLAAAQSLGDAIGADDDLMKETYLKEAAARLVKAQDFISRASCCLEMEQTDE